MSLLEDASKKSKWTRLTHRHTSSSVPAEQASSEPTSSGHQLSACLSLLSSPQSSCLVNLRLISGSSAGTHRVLHRCKTPWCPFYSRCSQWTVNSEWSRLIPSPPRPPTPSNTTTTTTQPTLFTRYFFFFFFRGPADIWTTSCHCVEKNRRVMTVCACVRASQLGRRKKKKPRNMRESAAGGAVISMC